MKVKTEKTKIVIIDDHPIVRQGLAQLINQEEDMICVGEAEDAASALKCIAKLKPDLLLVDIALKGTSGIELTKTVLASYPQMLILIVSMYDETIYLERCLRAGAKGYIMKQVATDYVTSIIRKVLQGEIYMSDQMRERLMNKFIGGKTILAGSSAEILTDRELDVLQLIGQGYATSQIAAELHISAKTVESHYANIKLKLELKNSHELIQYAVTWCLTQK